MYIICVLLADICDKYVCVSNHLFYAMPITKILIASSIFFFSVLKKIKIYKKRKKAVFGIVNHCRWKLLKSCWASNVFNSISVSLFLFWIKITPRYFLFLEGNIWCLFDSVGHLRELDKNCSCVRIVLQKKCLSIFITIRELMLITC